MSSAVRSSRDGVPFLPRFIAGHLLWSGVLVIGDLAARILVPDESFAPFWYISLIPLGYALIAVVLAVPNLGLCALAGTLGPRLRLPRYLATFLIAAAVTAVLLLGSWIARTNTADLIRATLTALVALPALALLVPLPIAENTRKSRS